MPKNKCFFLEKNLEEAIILKHTTQKELFHCFASVSSIIRPPQTKQCPKKRVKTRNQSPHCYGLSILLPYMGCSLWKQGL